jgi:hypothetical protein
VNQFTGFTVDTATAKWEIEYENRLTMQIEKVQVGMGVTLDLTPEQVKEIFNHAKQVQMGPGKSVLINISVSFNRVYPDGKTVPGKVTQQVISTNSTRAEHNAIYGGLPR